MKTQTTQTSEPDTILHTAPEYWAPIEPEQCADVTAEFALIDCDYGRIPND